MLASRRKTEITIQTREVVIVRQAASSKRQWCPRCRAERSFVLPEHAARIAAVTVRTIFRRVEEGRVHFHEGDDGQIRICLDSISKNVRMLQGGKE